MKQICLIYTVVFILLGCSSDHVVKSKSSKSDILSKPNGDIVSVSRSERMNLIELDTVFPNEHFIQLEKVKLMQFDSIVQRVNGALIFKIDNGVEVKLENVKANSESDSIENTLPKDVDFQFRDYYQSIRCYLVNICYYEGDNYYIINKVSGRKVVIPGVIAISPDAKRFVSFKCGLSDNYGFDGFVVYKIVNNDFVKEFEYTSNESSPTKVTWITNVSFEVENTGLDAQGKYKSLGSLQYQWKGKWSLSK